jgi:hypothetical protein
LLFLKDNSSGYGFSSEGRIRAVLRLGLRLRLEGKDREIRAKDFAEMAVYTVIFSFSLGVIIAFEIEGLGHPEDFARAVRDTELAPFAPLFDDNDPTLRDLNGSQIKWYTPIFHLNSFACRLNNHPGTRL